jgi:hypothetical protein
LLKADEFMRLLLLVDSALKPFFVGKFFCYEPYVWLLIPTTLKFGERMSFSESVPPN